MMSIQCDIYKDADGNTLIKTLEPIDFYIDWRCVTIPSGFVSDGASIPRCLWTLVDPPVTAETLIPSIVHDYLYRMQITTRETADELYDNMLEKNGYGEIKRWLVYKGLRWFGSKAWDEHTAELDKQK